MTASPHPPHLELYGSPALGPWGAPGLAATGTTKEVNPCCLYPTLGACKVWLQGCGSSWNLGQVQEG